MKTTEQVLEWMSETSDLIALALFLVALGYAAQALTTPPPRVATGAAVQLEGLVVTPKRVYSAAQWALSRPVRAVVVAASGLPLRAAQQCGPAGSA